MIQTKSSSNKNISRVGFWSGLLAFTFTLAYCIAQVAQMAGILEFPMDEILIYATSLCIVIPFLLEMLSLHYLVPDHKKFWSHTALLCSIIYTVFVTANYVVQLATVIPAKLNGTLSEISILDQTPHSMFWDFDAIGYIFMGLACLAVVPVFEKKGFQKWVGISFMANAIVTPLIAIVYFRQNFSEKLLLLGFPWVLTAPMCMLLLAIFLKKLNNQDR